MKLSSLYKKALRAKRQYLHPWCAAIIVAAGSATRMGGVDKIQADLCGQPVLGRTLAAFERCELVDEMIVVTRREQMERVSELCVTYPKVQMVVCGGETRVDSVCAGIAAVSEQTQLIAVHDGARPLITEELITKTADKAAKFSAAAPAIPVKDTIKVVKNGAVEQTPDRANLFAVQTPQIFDADLLRAALQNAKDKQLPITDDCSAVEALGMKVLLTEGSEENIKITTPLDLQVARLIWEERTKCESDTDMTSTG